MPTQEEPRLLHDTPLITTIVAGLGFAFILGAIAIRLRISPLVGYLLAGILAGPFTPGFVADQHLARELAEIGVILLMFGVGLHFSLKDLLSVRLIAIPGAVVQIAVATLLGTGLAALMGWSLAAGIVFGLALSVASTVVLLRALQERRLIETSRGRIAVGWLIVEDLAMVLTLVLLPALAGLAGGGEATAGGEPLGMRSILITIGVTLAKVGGFVALMFVVGRRVIPWILHYVAHSGSRELFRLAVLAVALGVAFGASELFGVSFALGAFFAGMILSESELSHRAAEESLPLRDAFAVLFFVSVGMLFDPRILLTDPWPILATFLIITIGKSIAAFLIVRAFGHPIRTALTISASLAQIGEFSFILVNLGVALALLPETGRDLVLAGAMLSILANPIFFMLLDRFAPWLDRRYGTIAEPSGQPDDQDAPIRQTMLQDHAIVVGYGRVGSVIGKGLESAGIPFVVIEDRREIVDALRRQSVEVIALNGVQAAAMQAANLAEARLLFLAIPNAFEAGQIAEQARTANPRLDIIARAHSDAEAEHLMRHGASTTIMGEREIANGMLARAFERMRDNSSGTTPGAA
ncbi:MAG: YbaL family putative K(+) efflux transporter [Dongiaceae bacterium]